MMRRLPSKIANWLLAKASGVTLHDFGTTYKAYRREVLEGVRLYGDMHRFVPAVCARLGAKIIEVPIKNVRRKAGKSNYGIARTFRVAMDLLTLRFLSKYMTRPLHFFGKWGLTVRDASGRASWRTGSSARSCSGTRSTCSRQHGPLMAMGFMLVIAGMLLLATGLTRRDADADLLRGVGREDVRGAADREGRV